MTGTISAIRGPVLTYSDEPYLVNKDHEFGYEPDAIIMLVDGQISEIGPAARLQHKIPSGSDVQQSYSCRFIKIHNSA